MKLCRFRYFKGDFFVILICFHLSLIFVLESFAATYHQTGYLYSCYTSSKSEITDLNTAVFVDKDISWLEVSVEDVGRVNVSYSTEQVVDHQLDMFQLQVNS